MKGKSRRYEVWREGEEVIVNAKVEGEGEVRGTGKG